jgi:hypothetical protein
LTYARSVPISFQNSSEGRHAVRQDEALRAGNRMREDIQDQDAALRASARSGGRPCLRRQERR